MFEEPGGSRVTVVFEPNLPLADMKARLVLNRLSARARVLATRPARGAARRGRAADASSRFSWRPTATPDELRALADVEGVAEIRIEPAASRRRTSTSQPSPASDPADRAGQAVRVATAARRAAVPPSRSRSDVRLPVAVAMPAPASAAGGDATGSPAAEPAPRPGEPRKAKVAETIRVESDRLDHLMNLAGELVITKARFVAIARDWRSSSAARMPRL